MAEAYLRRFPIHRRVQRSGLAYRITSLDELSTEYELFVDESYALAVGDRPVVTFIDLGSNAGWFALWLATRAGGIPKLGLLIEAHPRMVAEAAWHLTQNGLTSYVLVHGAVGLDPRERSAKFHLHPSTSASSLVAYQPDRQLPVKGKIKSVMVPAVSAAREWTKNFGDITVDLLKIDIEGKELDFLRYEDAFMRRRVRTIVLEWHKWCVSLAQLDAHLESMRFERRWVRDENEFTGLARYDNLGDIE